MHACMHAHMYVIDLALDGGAQGCLSSLWLCMHTSVHVCHVLAPWRACGPPARHLTRERGTSIYRTTAGICVCSSDTSTWHSCN